MRKISRRTAVKLIAGGGAALWLPLAFVEAAPPTGEPALLPGPLKVPYHGRFRELPVGSVKPKGWIKDWLQWQADGLTGHPENLAYPYDTCMYAGKIPPPPVTHGQTWWPYEQSGYFVDAAFRLNALITDPRVQAMVQSNREYLLNHSGPDHLGESYWGWPNTVVGRALMADYGITGDAKTAQVLDAYLEGSPIGGDRDGYVFEEALFLYGLTGNPRLLDIAKRGYDRYFLSDPRSFSYVDKIRGDAPLREHGVTAAEQLKLLPLMYSYTGDPQALELAKLAYRKVEADSLMPDGGMVSSERLGTTAFNSLHESCDITDWSWSFGYMLMASGEGHWGDRIEQAAFNALPGAVSKDFKQLQYFSSANQVLASNTACPRIAPTRMSYRAAHDTECCSGNVNRAMPNYVIRMWMQTDDGLAAALYGPSEVTTTINGHPVTITEETDYPFRETISFKIKTPKPAAFALRLRVPEWCAGATVTVNGKASGIDCKPGAFAVLQRQHRDGDLVLLRLPMTVQFKEWFGGRAASVNRGPLVYSLQIEENRVASTEDPPSIKRVLKGNNIQGFPALEFYPMSEWRYGLDSKQTNAPAGLKIIESPMPPNPFLAETAPVRIEAPLRVLPGWLPEWKATPEPATGDSPPPGGAPRAMPHNPDDLPAEADLQSAGPIKTMTLLPYGATYLRLTTLPLIPSA